MIRFSVVSALMVLAAASPAAADWEYTRWGMTADQVIAASGGKAKAMPPGRYYRNDAGGYEISVEGRTRGPPRLSIGFQFDLRSGGLQCVISNAVGDDAETLLALMVQRYGAPISDDSFGTTRTMQWTTPDAVELTMNATPKAAVVNHCAPGRS